MVADRGRADRQRDHGRGGRELEWSCPWGDWPWQVSWQVRLDETGRLFPASPSRLPDAAIPGQGSASPFCCPAPGVKSPTAHAPRKGADRPMSSGWPASQVAPCHAFSRSNQCAPPGPSSGRPSSPPATPSRLRPASPHQSRRRPGKRDPRQPHHPARRPATRYEVSDTDGQGSCRRLASRRDRRGPPCIGRRLRPAGSGLGTCSPPGPTPAGGPVGRNPAVRPESNGHADVADLIRQDAQPSLLSARTG